MFRKFRESPYFKAAMVVLFCGGVLIIFHEIVSKTRFSVGFETVNKTLAPVYIGTVFAFILCPVYNACVRYIYSRMIMNYGGRSITFANTPPEAALPADREGKEASLEERKRMLSRARTAASIVCVILIVGVVGLLLYFVVPQVVQSAVNLANTLPQRLNTLSVWLEVHMAHFPSLAKWVDNLANAGTSDIIIWVQEHVLNGNAMSLASMVSNGVYAAVKYLMNAFIGLLIMIYLLNYKERLFAITRKIVNATCGQKRQETLYEFAEIVNETFIGFIVGRILDSFIIGVLTYLVLLICGIHFASMIAVIVGVTNVIPFFGPFIGAIPSIFILMLEDPVQALYFIIIILVIQQLDGNLIGPKIVGNAIGISSFWVLMAVLIGGGVFGFTGMALGVPVFAVFYRYMEKLTARSLRHKNKSEDTKDYYDLEPFGIEDTDIAAEPVKKKEEKLFVRIGRLMKRG